jgi:hypothetical protein
MKLAYSASLSVGAVLILVYAFQASYSSSMSLISNAFFVSLSIAAIGSATIALKKYWRNLNDKYSQIWLLFTAGLLLWLISKVSWTACTMTPNATAPHPSFADALWIAGYVPIFAALHSYLRSFGFSLSRIRYSAFALTVSFALLWLYILLVPPVVAASEREMTSLLGLVYLGLDLSLFSLSVHGLFVFLNGRIGVAWAFVSGALFLNAVGNILFSYATQTNTYFNGHFLELIFHASSIFCTLAFYTHVKEL